MDVIVEIEDGESLISYRFKDGEFTVSRPTKGMTDLLREVAEVISEDEPEEIRHFLLQSSDMEVIIGKERCG